MIRDTVQMVVTIMYNPLIKERSWEKVCVRFLFRVRAKIKDTVKDYGWD